MQLTRSMGRCALLFGSLLAFAELSVASPAAAAWYARPQNQATAARPVGKVKNIAGNTITLTTDSGADVSVQIQESTSMMRTLPGQKDLKNAQPLPLQELQQGDRILVRGTTSDEGKTVLASSIVVMKSADIAEKQKRETDDWRQRGVGGLVSAVDAGGAITLSTAASGGSKTVTVRVSNDTIVRRYAPESVRFDEAVRSTLDQIKPGDQLRARGTLSADGSELAAEDIVSGTFRNISGAILAINPVKGTIGLIDLATKKPTVVKITAESQMRKLAPADAEMIATHLRGPAPAAVGAAAQGGRPQRDRQAGEASPGGAPVARSGHAPDFQHMLNHAPAATVKDLQKGDAVMMVATPGTANSAMTAITVLIGVEPILTAPNSGQAAMLLSPWNLGGGAAPDAP